MRKYTLFLLTFLMFTFFGLSFAKSSGDGKSSPLPADKIVLKFVNSKLPYDAIDIKKSKKALMKSLIATINSWCGKFKTNVNIIESGHCSVKDSNGNLVTFKVDCSGGSCVFSRKTQKIVKIEGQPTSFEIQATPNLPPKSSVGLGKWIKIFAGIMYAVLTVYLFVAAASNLFKREILFLFLDIFLWAALTAAMYTVIGGF